MTRLIAPILALLASTSLLLMGNGLQGMSERLGQLGGQLDIESKPGAGFRLYAWVPIENLS